MAQHKIVNGQRIELSAEEIAEIQASDLAWEAGAETRAWEQLREQRNQLLEASDWTQILDCTVDKVAWATYRQSLRDITDQEDAPYNVTLPTKPKEGE